MPKPTAHRPSRRRRVLENSAASELEVVVVALSPPVTVGRFLPRPSFVWGVRAGSVCPFDSHCA